MLLHRFPAAGWSGSREDAQAIKIVIRPDASHSATGEADEAGFRVILVDDEVATRHVLRRWFTARGFGDVVGEGGTVAVAFELVTGLQPDGVVLDDELPDGSGLEIVPQLLARCPSIRVVMFTDNPDVARDARNRGAVAGVFKGTPGALEAVRLALVKPHPGVAHCPGRKLMSSAPMSRPAADCVAPPASLESTSPAQAVTSRPVRYMTVTPVASGLGRALLETIPEGPARAVATADVSAALLDHHDQSGVRLRGGVWLVTASNHSPLTMPRFPTDRRPRTARFAAEKAALGASKVPGLLEYAVRGWLDRMLSVGFRPGGQIGCCAPAWTPCGITECHARRVREEVHHGRTERLDMNAGQSGVLTAVDGGGWC